MPQPIYEKYPNFTVLRTLIRRAVICLFFPVAFKNALPDISGTDHVLSIIYILLLMAKVLYRLMILPIILNADSFSYVHQTRLFATMLTQQIHGITPG